jgi:hypothetical protein
MAGRSRSGFRPRGLPAGLHKTAFTHLGGSFFPGHLTGRVSKAPESIHNDVIVRSRQLIMESRIWRRMKRGMGSGVKRMDQPGAENSRGWRGDYFIGGYRRSGLFPWACYLLIQWFIQR